MIVLGFVALMLVGISYATIEQENDLFYIYDWPDLVNRYANFTDRNHHSHGVEFPQWTQNFGAGRLIHKDFMEYKTSQFALFKIIYERALIDPRRTLDPNKATSFLIPYDFGMDASFFETNGRMRRTQCPLATEVIKRLKNSEHFLRKDGHDHTLIISVNQNMNYFFGAKQCIEMALTCWNCTKPCIDEYMFIAADRSFELKNRGINWHAVPFPSDYHYSSQDGITPPWLLNIEKKYLISFTGSPRRYNEHATAIREALVRQCGSHPKICVHGSYKHDGGSNDYSRTSVFCLQPPGDMPTRKSLFDSILSGCIPVLFHPLTARFMYEWHVKQEVWDEIALHYDTIEENLLLIRQEEDFIAKLEHFYNTSREVVQKKQARIREIAYSIQYSLIERSESNPYGRKASSMSDQKDAYDIVMDSILQIHSGQKSHDRVSEYLRCKYHDGKHGIKIQTADFCNRTYSNQDPFSPPSVVSPFFKKSHPIVTYASSV